MCTEATLVQGGEQWGPFGMPGHGATAEINRLVSPGEEVTVLAIFDPNAHGPAGIGRADRAVSVLMGGRRVLQLQFSAYVTP